MKPLLPLAALLLATTAPALAQNSAPQPVLPIVNTIPDARDVAYPGTLQLDVDATNTQQGIFNVKEVIPVAKSGHMVLLFPKWLQGNHGPRGEIEKLAGLQIRANGKRSPGRAIRSTSTPSISTCRRARRSSIWSSSSSRPPSAIRAASS
jgi:hypothetical protein